MSFHFARIYVCVFTQIFGNLTVLGNGNLDGQNLGGCLFYDPKIKVLTISVKYSLNNLISGTKIGALPTIIPKPPTTRVIPFLAINNDETISIAQLNVESNGDLIVYNSVLKNLNTPIIVGSCYIGSY